MLSNSVNSTTPIANVWSPGGVEIYNSTDGWSVSGWNIARSNNNLTLTHTLAKPILMGTAQGRNGSNLFVSQFIGKNASTLSIQNVDGNAYVKFNGITSINTGAATGGATDVIITFVVES